VRSSPPSLLRGQRLFWFLLLLSIKWVNVYKYWVHQIAHTNSLSLRDRTFSTQQSAFIFSLLFFDLEISSRTLWIYVTPVQFSCFCVKLKRLTDIIVWGGGCFSDAPRAVRLSSPVSSMVSSGARSGSPQCRCSHFTSETSCAINATREQARHRTHCFSIMHFPLSCRWSPGGSHLWDAKRTTGSPLWSKTTFR
jgi:hypothetical protein